MIAEVIINSNVKTLNKVFDYNIPLEMEKQIKIGSRVLLPFGNMKRLEEGFVINIKDESKFKVKDISKIEENILTDENIDLAKLMAKKYFCNVSDCIKLMLPPGTLSKNIDARVKEKTANYVYLAKPIDDIKIKIENGKIKSEKQIRLLKFLENSEGIGISDLEAFTDVSKNIMKTLEKNGYINIVEEQVERNPFKNKEIKSDKKRELNSQQKKCFEQVEFAMDAGEFVEFLLFGITGSRKNRNIYAINRKSYFK